MSTLTHLRPLLLCSSRDGTIGRQRRRGAKQDLPDVASNVGMSVDVLGDLARARAPATFGIDTVAVKLQVGEMRPVAVHRPHAVERRRYVARDAEIVAVNVRGMRQAQLIGGADQCFENRTRGHAAGSDRRIELDGPASLLPQLDAAGIHHLDGIAARRAQQPCRIVSGSRSFARVDEAEQIVVVPHEHEEARIDDGGVVELGVRQPGGQRRNGGVEHRRVPRPA